NGGDYDRALEREIRPASCRASLTDSVDNFVTNPVGNRPQAASAGACNRTNELWAVVFSFESTACTTSCGRAVRRVPRASRLRCHVDDRAAPEGLRHG